jgi:hypothetical protein
MDGWMDGSMMIREERKVADRSMDGRSFVDARSRVLRVTARFKDA